MTLRTDRNQIQLWHFGSHTPFLVCLSEVQAWALIDMYRHLRIFAPAWRGWWEPSVTNQTFVGCEGQLCLFRWVGRQGRCHDRGESIKYKTSLLSMFETVFELSTKLLSNSKRANYHIELSCLRTCLDPWGPGPLVTRDPCGCPGPSARDLSLVTSV